MEALRDLERSRPDLSACTPVADRTQRAWQMLAMDMIEEESRLSAGGEEADIGPVLDEGVLCVADCLLRYRGTFLRRALAGSDLSICCDRCEVWFHGCCVGVQSDNVPFRWQCASCNPAAASVCYVHSSLSI